MLASWIPKDYMLGTVPMPFLNSLSSNSIKNVDVFSSVPDYEFSIFMEHSTVEVASCTPFSTLEGFDSILFKQWDLLGTSKVATFTRVDFYNKSLDWAVVIFLVIGHYNPQLIV